MLEQNLEFRQGLSEYLSVYLDKYAGPHLLVCEGSVSWSSQSLQDLLQTQMSELIGRSIGSISSEKIEFDTTKTTVNNVLLNRPSGERVPVEVRTSPLGSGLWMLEFRPPSGELADVDTELLRDRLFGLAEELPVGVFYAETGLRLAWVNRAMATIFELPKRDILGTNWLEHFDMRSKALLQESAIASILGDSRAVEAELRSGSGARRTLRFSFNPIMTRSRSAGFIGSIEDITNDLAERAELSFAALHDPLTGLPNRLALNDELSTIRQRLRDHSITSVGVVFCDLNGFKAINDNLGHMAGDRLLIETANRLKQTCHFSETVYRYAGDEFVILLSTEDETLSQHERVRQRFKEAMARPVKLDNIEIQVSISIGLATTSSADEDLQRVLSRADESMYRDKRASRTSSSLIVEVE